MNYSLLRGVKKKGEKVKACIHLLDGSLTLRSSTTNARAHTHSSYFPTGTYAAPVTFCRLLSLDGLLSIIARTHLPKAFTWGCFQHFI